MNDDLISRQAAIDKMMELYNEDLEQYSVAIPEMFDGERAVEALNSLPSAQPEQTRWIITHVGCNGTDSFYLRCICSQCGLEVFVDVINFGIPTNACEHCIADMRFAIENCVRPLGE